MGNFISILSIMYFVSIVLKISNVEQVLIEPGTPHGSRIVSQMRSHILWMEKRVSSLFPTDCSLGQYIGLWCLFNHRNVFFFWLIMIVPPWNAHV